MGSLACLLGRSKPYIEDRTLDQTGSDTLTPTQNCSLAMLPNA
jgi:hypothetical protein